MNWGFLFCCSVLALISNAEGLGLVARKAFACRNSECQQQPIGAFNGTSLGACAIACGPFGNIWPQPKVCHLGHFVESIAWPPSFQFSLSRRLSESVKVSKLFDSMKNLFLTDLKTAQDAKLSVLKVDTTEGQSVNVVVDIEDLEVVRLKLETDESYRLDISCEPSGPITAKISAKTVFGARHGLETLSQLIALDDISATMKISCDVQIQDEPAYPYRGVLLDTSRHFYPVSYIRHLIDAMAYNKLNRFHWHITDYNSFPLQIVTYPEMTFYGAYSPEQVYLQSEVKELVQHAKLRGVTIVPEIDAPGHVGFGWDWMNDRNFKEPLILCMDQRCITVPCSVLNIANSQIYNVLKAIYTELFQVFEQPEIFHMGGDELNFTCWKNDKKVLNFIKDTLRLNPKNNSSFFEAWADFQSKAYEVVKDVAKGNERVSAVLWSSNLTNDHLDILLKYQSNQDYIVEIWEETTSPVLVNLLNHNIRVILANSDAWYLDCGFGNWVGESPNWCSPYKSWQRIYNQRLDYDVLNGSWHITDSNQRKLILGGEVAMWSEEADALSADVKIWPRAAALAERLWSDPTPCWIDGDTSGRMLLHRERLVSRGIRADATNPQSCLNTGAKSCFAQLNEWKPMKLINKTTCIQYRPHPAVLGEHGDGMASSTSTSKSNGYLYLMMLVPLLACGLFAYQRRILIQRFLYNDSRSPFSHIRLKV